MEAATSVMFQGFTRIAPAPKDCAAPANYNKADKCQKLSRVITKRIQNKLLL